MIGKNSPLILGSGSPRRSQILQTIGIPIRVVAGHTNEDHRDGESPEAYLHRVVLEKLADVASRMVDMGPVTPFGGVLVADTIVVDGSKILGKPADRVDAFRMIRSLSGRPHEVLTRFALASDAAPSVPVHQETVRTVVHFRNLTDSEITRYVDTGEGLDKAGAYAAQGIGAFLVSRIDGSFYNVVGLPACEVVSALVGAGLVDMYPF